MSSASALLLCLALTFGCMFYTNNVRVMPPDRSGSEGSHRLSNDAIREVVEAVGKVAKDKGFRTKRAMGLPLASKLLVYYSSPEQISITVWLSKRSRYIRIRIRDVNHTTVTAYTESIRLAITDAIQSKLPDHEISYD